LCGKDHGFMPVVVEAVSPEDYRAWVSEQTGDRQTAAVETTMDEMDRETLMTHGEDIYQAHCAACHREDGSGMQPAFPALAGSAVVTGEISQHIDVVVNGRPGTAMAAFGQRLDARDIAAALTYTRNAFGNETGDLVQPADVVSKVEPRLDESLVSAGRASN